MNDARHDIPLTAKDLAARWDLTEEQVRRRIKSMGIPGFNVGTAREPDWRFRLSTIEAWEARNEQDINEPPDPTGPATIPAGAPPAWDGKSRLKGPARVAPKG